MHGHPRLVGTILSTWTHQDYSQALAKIERGFARDVADVNAMIDSGLIEKPQLLQLFEAIRANLVRYPSLDPESFERAVHHIADDRDQDDD